MTDRELLQQVLDAWQDHWVNDNQSALLEMIRANCANCARCSEREWQGLTEAERLDILDAELTTQTTEHFALAQAIEAKLKEKNT
jgi:hypothetical protein